jgi:hypothetical protein
MTGKDGVILVKRDPGREKVFARFEIVYGI